MNGDSNGDGIDEEDEKSEEDRHGNSFLRDEGRSGNGTLTCYCEPPKICKERNTCEDAVQVRNQR